MNSNGTLNDVRQLAVEDWQRPNIVALDLDGTVLDRRFCIHPRTLRAVRSVSKLLPVVVATGRMLAQTMPFVELLQTRSPFICGQGALTYSASGKIVQSVTLDRWAATRAAAMAAEVAPNVIAYVDGHAFTEGLSEAAIGHLDIMRSEIEVVPDLPSVVTAGCEKLVCVFPEAEHVCEFLERMRNRLGAAALVVCSSPHLVEVISHDCGKGRALADLCRNIGIDTVKLLAVGDSENDVDMLRLAAIPIAVQGSSSEVCRSAIATCVYPDHAGVADVLEHLVLRSKFRG